ncbi:MAG: hypothetical protein DRJ15_08915, partial [Bacteroidetes bacterium]
MKTLSNITQQESFPGLSFFLAVFSMLSLVVVSCNFQSGSESDAIRKKYSLNKNWDFSLVARPHTPAIQVDLPHTWNATDTLNEEGAYLRSTGIYRKELILDKKFIGKRLFLRFEGSNQVTDVYVNSLHIDRHQGGYTGFTVEITDHVKLSGAEPNMLEVRVNNEFNKQIPPLSADFTFYGGIYRDVWLVVSDPIHVTLLDFGSEGLYISTPGVSEKEGRVEIRGSIENQSGTQEELLLVCRITKDREEEQCRTESQITINSYGQTNFLLKPPPLKHPKLWSPDSPSMYFMEVALYKSGKLIDRVESSFGFRFFSFHPENGFMLNGRSLKLVGTNRHQDYKGLGNALS